MVADAISARVAVHGCLRLRDERRAEQPSIGSSFALEGELGDQSVAAREVRFAVASRSTDEDRDDRRGERR
jgi:hypothetical protein